MDARTKKSHDEISLHPSDLKDMITIGMALIVASDNVADSVYHLQQTIDKNLLPYRLDYLCNVDLLSKKIQSQSNVNTAPISTYNAE